MEPNLTREWQEKSEYPRVKKKPLCNFVAIVVPARTVFLVLMLWGPKKLPQWQTGKEFINWQTPPAYLSPDTFSRWNCRKVVLTMLILGPIGYRKLLARSNNSFRRLNGTVEKDSCWTKRSFPAPGKTGRLHCNVRQLKCKLFCERIKDEVLSCVFKVARYMGPAKNKWNSKESLASLFSPPKKVCTI